MRMEDPRQLDVGCDDKVLLTLQYSTQWDAFCHMGQMFDADGDGVDEIRYYNGWRGGIDVVGPVDYDIATGKDVPRSREMGARRWQETTSELLSIMPISTPVIRMTIKRMLL